MRALQPYRCARSKRRRTLKTAPRVQTVQRAHNGAVHSNGAARSKQRRALRTARRAQNGRGAGRIAHLGVRTLHRLRLHQHVQLHGRVAQKHRRYRYARAAALCMQVLTYPITVVRRERMTVEVTMDTQRNRT
jgi:hypothetical protein